MREIQVHPLLLWAGDALRDAEVLDVSVGGIAVSVKNGTAFKVGQEVLLTHGSHCVPAIVKHVSTPEKTANITWALNGRPARARLNRQSCLFCRTDNGKIAAASFDEDQYSAALFVHARTFLESKTMQPFSGIRHFLCSEDGLATVEYAVLLLLILIVCLLVPLTRSHLRSSKRRPCGTTRRSSWMPWIRSMIPDGR